MTTDPKYRPPLDERRTDGMRTNPVRIDVRTEWLYSEPDPKEIVPAGRKRHAFSTSGHVTRTDVPSPYEHMQDIVSNVHRAVAAFGDDKDLVIEVRLADSDISTLEQQLPISLPDDHELLAVATIAHDGAGEYSLHIRNVVDATITMTPSQQANALRVLATGIEAEAVGREENP